MNPIQEIEKNIMHRLSTCDENVFLRDDFSCLGTKARVSQAIANLQGSSILEKIGYGVYMRPGCLPAHVIASEAKVKIGAGRKRHLTIYGKIYTVNKEHSQSVATNSVLLSKREARIHLHRKWVGLTN